MYIFSGGEGRTVKALTFPARPKVHRTSDRSAPAAPTHSHTHTLTHSHTHTLTHSHTHILTATMSTPAQPAFRYRGASLIRNSPPLGTYSNICLGPYGGPGGGGRFLMSEEPL